MTLDRQLHRPGCGPVTGLPLSSLTNVAAWEDSHWLELFDDLGTYSHDKHIFNNRVPPNIVRKGWEWTQTVWGLERLGMLSPESRGIGVGAGRECVIFWLGDRIKRVVATDLYGNPGWLTEGGQEADPAVLEDPQAFCPRPINSDAIEFRTMDGTDLSYFPDGSLDFAWSLSSIEHFGSHDRAGDAVREMARVVRTGGILAVATEYLVLPDLTHHEFFNRDDFERYILDATEELELVEPVDWSLPPSEYLIDPVLLWGEVGRTRRHVIMQDKHLLWTSILVFFRKV